MTTEAPNWDITNLLAWQVAMDYAHAVHEATKDFPADERYGLATQFRRSAVSVAANIAEGHGRASRREFARFLRIAQGSLKESETHARLAARFGYLSDGTLQRLLALSNRINRLLTGLRHKLEGVRPR